MTTRTLILALFFGASVAVGSQLLKLQLTAVPQEKMSEVLVLLQDVPRGKTLTPEMLAKRSYQAGALPFGVVGKLEEAVGRVAAVALRKGVLFENMLSRKGALAGLQGMIPEGKRAFTIRTPNVASGVAGLLQPEDHVDVLLTVDRDDEDADSGGGAVVTLLRDIEVLAVDQHLDGSVTPPTSDKAKTRAVSTSTAIKSVTLIVSPDDAMRLSLAQSKGTLQLTLRSAGGGVEENLSGVVAVTFNDLLGRTKKVVQASFSKNEGEEKKSEAKVDAQPAPQTAPAAPVTPAPSRDPFAEEIQVAQVPEAPALPPIVMYEGNSRSSVTLSMVQGRHYVTRFAPASVAIAATSTRPTSPHVAATGR